MRNTGLEEAQAGIKIAGRNINNLRYADDITLRGESKKELKSLLMKVKEEDFPGGPVVKNSPFIARDTSSVPGQGTKIPHTLRPKKKTNKKAIL